MDGIRLLLIHHLRIVDLLHHPLGQGLGITNAAGFGSVVLLGIHADNPHHAQLAAIRDGLFHKGFVFPLINPQALFILLIQIRLQHQAEGHPQNFVIGVAGSL